MWVQRRGLMVTIVVRKGRRESEVSVNEVSVTTGEQEGKLAG